VALAHMAKPFGAWLSVLLCAVVLTGSPSFACGRLARTSDAMFALIAKTRMAPDLLNQAADLMADEILDDIEVLIEGRLVRWDRAIPAPQLSAHTIRATFSDVTWLKGPQEGRVPSASILIELPLEPNTQTGEDPAAALRLYTGYTLPLSEPRAVLLHPCAPHPLETARRLDTLAPDAPERRGYEILAATIERKLATLRARR
jgi:hypothetical protein